MQKIFDALKSVAKLAVHNLTLRTMIVSLYVRSALENVYKTKKPFNLMKKAAEILTCHQALYALMAVANAGFVLRILDKATYSMMAVYIYFALAIRP